MKSILLASALLAATAGAAVVAQTTPGSPPPGAPPGGKPISAALISLEDAQTLARLSLAACAKRGEAASVYVVDADGHIRVAESADNAVPIGLRTASLKSATVLAFHASTRDLQARLKTDQAFADQNGKDARYFWSPGGVPLYRDGQLVAALAVGGAHDIDESCALDAVKALPWVKTQPN